MVGGGAPTAAPLTPSPHLESFLPRALLSTQTAGLICSEPGSFFCPPSNWDIPGGRGLSVPSEGLVGEHGAGLSPVDTLVPPGHQFGPRRRDSLKRSGPGSEAAAIGFSPWPLARPDSLVPGTLPGWARVWRLPGLGARLRSGSLWRSPWHGNWVVSQGPSLVCRVGVPSAAPQGLREPSSGFVALPWLSSGTELALLPHSKALQAPRPSWGGTRASWESAQGFFPGFSGKRSRERLKVSQRRGRGRGRTRPCLALQRSPWGSGKM